MLGLFWTFYGLVAIRWRNRYARVPTCHVAPLTIRRDGRRVEAEARGGSRRRVRGRVRRRAPARARACRARARARPRHDRPLTCFGFLGRESCRWRAALRRRGGRGPETGSLSRRAGSPG